MKNYIVRFNVEYSKVVEANSDKEAIQLASLNEEDWDQKSISGYEADEE